MTAKHSDPICAARATGVERFFSIGANDIVGSPRCDQLAAKCLASLELVSMRLWPLQRLLPGLLLRETP
jgi:hypothetical protein